MNRKGQIAMIMLFLVALVMSIAALYSFTLVDRKFGDGSLVVSGAFASADFGEQYVLSSSELMAKEAILSKAPNLALKFQEIAEKRWGLGIREAGSFFKVVGDGNFEFGSFGSNYLLKMGDSDDFDKKIAINTKSGDNEVTRYVEVCMIFDSKGELLSRWKNEQIYADFCK